MRVNRRKDIKCQELGQKERREEVEMN